MSHFDSGTLHSSSSSSCALCLDQAGFFFSTKWRNSRLHTKLRSLSTLTSFNLSRRRFAPRWYHGPLPAPTSGLLPTLHMNLRNGRMSPVDSDTLSSYGSYCAPLPFITSVLPTTYAKLGNGGMSSVDSASLSLSSSSSCCASVQCICCAPCAPPTIEVSFIQSSVTEPNMTVAIDSNALPHSPPLFDIVRLCCSHHWGFLSHKAA